MDPTSSLGLVHRRRLREIWCSAGWPCQDMVELELVAAGLVERLRDGDGRETLRTTAAGVTLLAQTLKKNRAARDAHEALVERVAEAMQRAGRIVWRGLSLRAPLADPDAGGERLRWPIAMPDVYSIRHTSVEDYLEPIAPESKVRRADLLGDLRRADKGAAYLALASQCWYVLRAGIAQESEIPPAYGVMVAHDDGALEVVRPAPRRALRLPFSTWMALARAAPLPSPDEAPQRRLGAPEAAPGAEGA